MSRSCRWRGGPIMGESASPLMLRRRLRTELRMARINKELTQEQVAKAMEWSLSKMNRIEKAKTGISTNDLKALLPLYGITDKERTDELLALARAARQSPWWSRYSDVAPPELLELIEYEYAASAVSQFETMFVPGILQTEEYASAVLRGFYGEKSPSERVAALIELRTRRRDLLTSDNAPNFSFRAGRVCHPPPRRQPRHHQSAAHASSKCIRAIERDDTSRTLHGWPASRNEGTFRNRSVR